MPRSHLFLTCLLSSLVATGCRSRQETKVDTVLDRQLVREHGPRVPSQDRATIQPDVQPDGSALLVVDWRPACRTREVERRTVRTDTTRGVAGEHLVFGGTFAVGGATAFVWGLTSMDEHDEGSGAALGAVMLGGLAAFFIGSGALVSDAEYLMTTPEGKVHTETRPHGPWLTSTCPSQAPAITLSFPGATLQAVLGSDGTAEFTIAPWMWEQNDGVIDAEVRVNGQPSGHVRLVRHAAE